MALTHLMPVVPPMRQPQTSPVHVFQMPLEEVLLQDIQEEVPSLVVSKGSSSPGRSLAPSFPEKGCGEPWCVDCDECHGGNTPATADFKDSCVEQLVYDIPKW